MAAYPVTVWVNNTTPPLSAANLNKLTNELESQAAAIGLAHTLPNWADGVAPALTTAAPLNEMERVLDLVAADQGLSYTPTVWAAGWSPARNAINLNKMENQAAANRNALDSVPPAPANDQAGILVFNYGGQTWNQGRNPYVATVVFAPDQTANIAAFVAAGGTKGRALCYKTIAETVATNSATSWASVPTTQTVAAGTRRDLTGAVPADEVKWHDANDPSDQWMLWNSSGNPMYYGGFSQSMLVDPASATYQARVYAYLVDQITSRGYDGIWSDNVITTTDANAGYPRYRRNSSGQLVIAYSTPAAFSDAMVSLVQNTLGRLKTDGYYSGGNCHYYEATPPADYNNGTRVQVWNTRCGPYLNAVTNEYASLAAGAPSPRAIPTVQWYDYLDGWTTLCRDAATSVGAAHSQGIGDSQVDQFLRYAMGVVRTLWDGSSPAAQVAFFAPLWPTAITQFVWGNAVGAMMTSGSLRARRWTNGWAVINTSRSTASATFSDPLLGGTRAFNNIPAVDAYLGA